MSDDARLSIAPSLTGKILARLQEMPLRKLGRFSVVGVISASLYAVFTAMAIRGAGIDAKAAGLLAYAMVVPFNFAANRTYTFGSSGRPLFDLLRYGILQSLNASVCTLLMWLTVDLLGWHYATGIMLGILCVPICTYLAMDLWVFRQQTAQ